MTFDFSESSGETSNGGSSSALDFVKGFITGQIALLSLLFILVRFLFFRSVGPVLSSSNSIRLDSSSFSRKPQNSKSDVKHGPAASIDNDLVLLEKLFGLDHQVLKHQTVKAGIADVLISDESANWLTFLLSKLVFNPLRVKLSSDPELMASWLQDRISEIQTRKLANVKALKHLNSLQVKSVEIGNLNPIINSYQLCYDAESESCLFRIKCSWQDAFSVDVDSAFSVLSLIALPFSVSIRLKNLSFTAQVKTSSDGDFCEVSCLSDDNLLIELEVGSLVGHRTKLKDLPKIKNAIVEVVKKLLLDKLINPKCIRLPLPKFDANAEWLSPPQSEQINVANSTAAGDEDKTFSKDYLDQSAIFADSIISDESERINVFVDSRYEDDFGDEALSEALLGSVKVQ